MGAVIFQAEWQWTNSFAVDSEAGRKALVCIQASVYPQSNLIGRTKLKTGRYVTLRVPLASIGWGTRRNLESFLVLLRKPAQRFQLELFIWGVVWAGRRMQLGRKHTHIPQNNSKMQGTSEVRTRIEIPAQSSQILSNQTATLCVPSSSFVNGQQSNCRWSGLMPLRPLRWSGPCKLIHCLIKAISKSILDLTSRQYIVASPWWEWHVNSN